MVLHEVRVRSNRFGGTSHGTLCGRTNRACTDGMNIASTSAEVTCKFCLKRMEQIA